MPHFVQGWVNGWVNVNNKHGGLPPQQKRRDERSRTPSSVDKKRSQHQQESSSLQTKHRTLLSPVAGITTESSSSSSRIISQSLVSFDHTSRSPLPSTVSSSPRSTPEPSASIGSSNEKDKSKVIIPPATTSPFRVGRLVRSNSQSDLLKERAAYRRTASRKVGTQAYEAGGIHSGNDPDVLSHSPTASSTPAVSTTTTTKNNNMPTISNHPQTDNAGVNLPYTVNPTIMFPTSSYNQYQQGNLSQYYSMAHPQMVATTGQYVNELAFANQQRYNNIPSNIPEMTATTTTNPKERKLKDEKSPPNNSNNNNNNNNNSNSRSHPSMNRDASNPVGVDHGLQTQKPLVHDFHHPPAPSSQLYQQSLKSPSQSIPGQSPYLNLHSHGGVSNTVTTNQHPQQQPQMLPQYHFQDNKVINMIHDTKPKTTSCSHCHELENHIKGLSYDLEYLRSIALQSEFICSECGENGVPNINNNDSSTSGGVSSSGRGGGLHRVNSSLSLASGKHSITSGMYSISSSRRKTVSGMSKHKQHLDSTILAESSQRLIAITYRHKKQIENLTKETARWENDMHLKLSKLSLMCKELNDESSKRKQESVKANNELDRVRKERNMISSELEILRARVELYEKQQVENAQVRQMLREQENETLDVANAALTEKDSIINDLTIRLQQTLDTLELERYQQRQRRQIIFPNRSRQADNTSQSMHEGLDLQTHLEYPD